MVQHVTRDNMLDADISDQTIQFNDSLDTCLKDSKLLIPSMGYFTLTQDGRKTPQWDLTYEDNNPTDAEYGLMANENALP